MLHAIWETRMAEKTTAFGRFLQQRLNAHGYKLQMDGIAGERTRDALRAFQRRKGLKVTGTATQETVDALRAAASPPPVPQPRPAMSPEARFNMAAGGAQVPQEQRDAIMPMFREALAQQQAGDRLPIQPTNPASPPVAAPMPVGPMQPPFLADASANVPAAFGMPAVAGPPGRLSPENAGPAARLPADWQQRRADMDALRQRILAAASNPVRAGFGLPPLASPAQAEPAVRPPTTTTGLSADPNFALANPQPPIDDDLSRGLNEAVLRERVKRMLIERLLMARPQTAPQ